MVQEGVHCHVGRGRERECAHWICQKRDQSPNQKKSKVRKGLGSPTPRTYKKSESNKHGIGAGIAVRPGA